MILLSSSALRLANHTPTTLSFAHVTVHMQLVFVCSCLPVYFIIIQEQLKIQSILLVKHSFSIVGANDA